MSANRVSEEYKKGVNEFIQFAFEKLPENNGRFYCPCVKCFNRCYRLMGYGVQLNITTICVSYVFLKLI